MLFFDETALLMEYDFAMIQTPKNQLDILISAEEMRDMICEEFHDFDRDTVLSHLLHMGDTFSFADFFPLMLYFDNLYMMDAG